MKLHYVLPLILVLLSLPFLLNGQTTYEDVVYLKNGSIIRGVIIEQILNQSIKIQTKDNSLFVFNMDEIEKITKEQHSVVNANKITPVNSHKSYTEIYFFAGFSSQKKIMSGTIQTTPFDISYKNGGLGGLGVAGLFIGKNRRPDVGLDFELSFYGAKMTTKTYSPPVEIVMSGLATCFDMHFRIFPIKARNKYPSPFILVGIGARIIKLTYGGTSVSEIHGEIPFGIGVRQKISRIVAFQIEERFVYSKLKEVKGFILPETRFAIILTMGRK